MRPSAQPATGTECPLSPISLTVRAERWPIAGTFTISRGAKTEAAVVVAELSDGTIAGAANACPMPAMAKRVESVAAAIEAMRPQIARGLDRAGLQQAMAAGRGPQCARLRVLGS